MDSVNDSAVSGFGREWAVERLAAAIKAKHWIAEVMPVVKTDSGNEVYFVDYSDGRRNMVAIDFNNPKDMSFRLIPIILPMSFMNMNPRIYTYDLTDSGRSWPFFEVDFTSDGMFRVTSYNGKPEDNRWGIQPENLILALELRLHPWGYKSDPTEQ